MQVDMHLTCYVTLLLWFQASYQVGLGVCPGPKIHRNIMQVLSLMTKELHKLTPAQQTAQHQAVWDTPSEISVRRHRVQS